MTDHLDDLKPSPPPFSENNPAAEAADPYFQPANSDLIKQYAQMLWFPETWAAEFGVDEYIMYSWIHKFPEFAEAYAVALTILKSEFSKKMVKAATGALPDANAMIMAKIAQLRFPETYAEKTRAPAAPMLPNTAPGGMIDVTPYDPAHPKDTGGDISNMDSEDLLNELAKLKKRHGV